VLREFKQEWPLEYRLKEALDQQDARIFAVLSSDQAHREPNGHGRFPYAVAVVTPSEPDLDLILWVRGCYRNSGLGTSLLKGVIDKLRTDGNHKDVKVYLPEVLPDKPGAMQEKDGWVRFYGRQGFVVIPSTASGRSVLKWSEQTQPQPQSGARASMNV
jgi:GNAT superfamily N-acetyltransferase